VNNTGNKKGSIIK